MSCDDPGMTMDSMPADGQVMNFMDSEPERSATLNFDDDVATFKRISSPTEKELKDGCTVEGHSTGQRFRQIHIDLEDAETCLKLFLVGFEEQEVVATAKKKKKKKKRKTVKDDKITDLERENLRLQQELENLQSEEEEEEEEEADAAEEEALAENQRLKDELAAKKKKKKVKGQAKKTTRTKKTTTRIEL